MKIALLNLPIDNNYGGNLQRYALMKVLQDMGHDVTHVNLRFGYHLPWYKKPFSYTKRLILKYIFGKDIKINQERFLRQQYKKRCAVTEPFYQRYIKHTNPITDLRKLKELDGFDAFVVGSDQVWRKKIAGRYLSTMFLDFLPDKSTVKRIAYGVSLGVSENELNQEEVNRLSDLYKRFDAVSVREDSALNLFKEYGWINPKAIQVLDPTMLLTKDDYLKLIENGNTVPSKGNMFCYILDKTEEKSRLIKEKAEELQLNPFELGLNDDKPVSIEQWLRSFADAEYVITDSYHGLVFSIIFRKPFYPIRNEFRGNARFDCVLKLFGVIEEFASMNWLTVSKIIDIKREKTLNTLNVTLNVNFPQTGND